MVRSSGFTYLGGHHAAADLLAARHRRPTAIVAGADPIAFGALGAIRECGLSVPGDVPVVGFDDLPHAAHGTPGLTTVRQPLHDMERAGVRALLSLIAGQPLATGNIILPTTLTRRATTAAPRPGAAA